MDGYIYGNYMSNVWTPTSGHSCENLIRQRLRNYWYYQLKHMPVLRRNIWIPIPFTLVVDHFGVGFVRRDHSDHLMSVLKKMYKEIITYWEGNLYCRITTKLYYSKRYVDISIPGHFNDALHQLNH